MDSSAQGYVCAVGGGSEDYGRWSDIPYRWMVDMAGKGSVLVMHTEQGSVWLEDYFRSFGASSAASLVIGNRTAADDSANYRAILSARMVFLRGGDQYDYVRIWKGTLVEEAIRALYENGGVVGGTSAGCAVLGEVVFDAKYGTAYPEQVAYDPYDTRVHFTDDFLGLLPGILFDTHFHSRGRMGRLVPMLARRIQDQGEAGLLAVGIADNTALCIDPDLSATVYGDGTVTFLSASEESVILCEPGKAPTFTNVSIDQLVHGAVYDLKTKTLRDGGEYLDSTGDAPRPFSFRDTVLDGSKDSTALTGEKVVTNILGNPLAAWNGNLGQIPGSGIVPGSVIVPKLWEDDEYFENRWMGGMWGALTLPQGICMYLDNGCLAEISYRGVVTAKGLVYILDTREATHAGTNEVRRTNYSGFVKAKFHFLGDGESFDLAAGGTYMEGQPERMLEPRRIDAFPNPFNAETTIRFRLVETSNVTISIIDLNGRKALDLFEGCLPSGMHTMVWRADTFPSGIYFIRVCAGDLVLIRKGLLVR